MEISETLKRILSKYENEIDSYQFEGVYSELEYGDDVGMFTEMMLSVGIDPAEHLGYIPSGYLRDSKMERYNIPNGATSIGDWAFSDGSRLTSVTIPDSVPSIEWGAFSGCNKLKDINYRGTIEQWKKIKKEEWTFSEIKIHCIDGDI